MGQPQPGSWQGDTWLQMAPAPFQVARGLRVLIAALGKRRVKRTDRTPQPPSQGSELAQPRIWSREGRRSFGKTHGEWREGSSYVPSPIPHSRIGVLTCIDLHGSRNITRSICRPGTPSCLVQSSSSLPSNGPLGQRS